MNLFSFDEVKKQIQANKDDQERKGEEFQRIRSYLGSPPSKNELKSIKIKNSTEMMKDEPYYVTLERHKEMVESVYLEKGTVPAIIEAFKKKGINLKPTIIRNFLKKHNIQNLKKKARVFTEQDIQDIINKLNAGMDRRELAKEYDIQYSSLGARLSQLRIRKVDGKYGIHH